MRARLLVATAVTLAIPTFIVVLTAETVGTPSTANAAPASAQPSPAPTANGRPLDPNNVTNISAYMQSLVRGNAQFLSGDYPAAIATYRQAIQMNEKTIHHPLGYYLLGVALHASGNDKEAEERWRQADANAGPSDATLKGRILFAIANLKEHQKKWDEARTAWNAYSEWAARFANAPADAGVRLFPQSAAARIKAMDDVAALDKVTEGVRQHIRIAAETDGGLFSNPDAAPPAHP